MSNGKLELVIGGDTGSAAYLTLPNHPGRGKAGVVSETKPLDELIGRPCGAEVYLNFDAAGNLIGIELLFDDDVR